MSAIQLEIAIPYALPPDSRCRRAETIEAEAEQREFRMQREVQGDRE